MKYEVFRTTNEARYELERVAEETPEIYLDPDTDFDAILRNRGFDNYAEQVTEVWSERPFVLTPVDSGPRNRADQQALDFYNGLVGITPGIAADENMWVWMCHFKLHSYGISRWRRQSNTDLRRYIKAHWFAEGSGQEFRMRNTAARTWWIAHTALKAAGGSGGAFDAKQALEHYANNAVHWHLLMKDQFSRSPLIVAELTRVLLNEAQGISAEKGFRALLRMLNLESGTRVLDALPRLDLREIITEYVEEIMSDPDMVSDRNMLRQRKPFRVLNLGAGVQSSCLALMAARGELKDQVQPDVAVFADTGWEPPSVYEHLEWLKQELPFPVITVSAGNIRDNVLNGKQPDGKPYLGIPAHLVKPDGTRGLARRQCTDDYKIRPIQSWIREYLGVERGKLVPKHLQVEMWMGISVDESERQRDSRDVWITKRYPLIEIGASRSQLLSWFMDHYPGRYLPRSACVGCPYKSDSEWKWLKENYPKSFQEAVDVDIALRHTPKVREAITANGDRAYIHGSGIPLASVDFSSTVSYDDIMTEECEGLCGL